MNRQSVFCSTPGCCGNDITENGFSVPCFACGKVAALTDNGRGTMLCADCYKYYLPEIKMKVKTIKTTTISITEILKALGFSESDKIETVTSQDETTGRLMILGLSITHTSEAEENMKIVKPVER